jgi:hypothetical protein
MVMRLGLVIVFLFWAPSTLAATPIAGDGGLSLKVIQDTWAPATCLMMEVDPVTSTGTAFPPSAFDAVDLTATGAGGCFYMDSACSQGISTVQISPSASGEPFYYAPAPGTSFISASSSSMQSYNTLKVDAGLVAVPGCLIAAGSADGGAFTDGGASLVPRVQTVDAGGYVSLSGAGSRLGGQLPASFAWGESMGPTGVQLAQGSQQQDLILGVPGDYVFTLTVQFDGGTSYQASATVHVLGANTRPSQSMGCAASPGTWPLALLLVALLPLLRRGLR